MIYEYKDLKGIIKVGDRVRAVEGKTNDCGGLNDDGSNERKITEVTDESFYIGHNCFGHSYDEEGSFLDLIRESKTLDDLQVGDEVASKYGNKEKVLARLEQCVLLSMPSGYTDWETKANGWFHIEEMKSNGYTLNQPTPEPTKVELTVGELEEKLQMPSGTLRIKKE